MLTELAGSSPEFQEWWAAHELNVDRAVVNPLRHPDVGDLELMGEPLRIPGEDDLWLLIYVAELASPTAAALEHLGALGSSPRLPQGPSA